jgi:hypothetical protein
MSRKNIPPDGAEVERLRQVRRAIEREHKDAKGYCAYVESLYRSAEASSKTVSRKSNIKSDAIGSQKAGCAMSSKKIPPDGAEVERLRRVRRSIWKSCKNADGYWAWVQSLEAAAQASGIRSSSKSTTRKAKKKPAASAKPHSRPSVRK